MINAPKVIWLHPQGGTHFPEDPNVFWWTQAGPGSVRYIRADLIDDRDGSIKRIVKNLAEMGVVTE